MQIQFSKNLQKLLSIVIGFVIQIHSMSDFMQAEYNAFSCPFGRLGHPKINHFIIIFSWTDRTDSELKGQNRTDVKPFSLVDSIIIYMDGHDGPSVTDLDLYFFSIIYVLKMFLSMKISSFLIFSIFSQRTGQNRTRQNRTDPQKFVDPIIISIDLYFFSFIPVPKCFSPEILK